MTGLRRAGTAAALVVTLCFAATAAAWTAPDPGGSETAAGPVPPSGGKYFGFSTAAWRETNEPRYTAAEQAELGRTAGSNAQRVLFDWQYAEYTKGIVDLGPYRELYNALQARGIRPVFILANAPSWARDPADVARAGCTGNCHYPPARTNYADWRRVASQLATAFPNAAAIEVWNEPNLAGFFHPAPDPVRFVEIQREAYKAIKAVAPGMKVLAGGFSNSQDTHTSTPDIGLREFLDRAYAAGLASAMNAIAFHPYPETLQLGANTLFAKSFQDVRAVAAARGDSGRRLWLTETGISSSGQTDEAGQADLAARLYRRALSMPDVDALFFHELIERPWLGGTEAGFGFHRRLPAFLPAPKPAYCHFVKRAGRSYLGC